MRFIVTYKSTNRGCIYIMNAQNDASAHRSKAIIHPACIIVYNMYIIGAGFGYIALFTPYIRGILHTVMGI